MSEPANKELEKSYLLLKSIYGRGLIVATLTILVKTEDGYEYVSNTFPQEVENETP